MEFDALTFLSNNNNEFPCPQHPGPMATGDDDLRPTTTTMTMARRATKLMMMATTTTMATGGKEDDNGDGAPGDCTTGDNDGDNNGNG
jgi:hypothetical protein